MEKRCLDCTYKVYEARNPNWPFCSCVEKELREYAQEWDNHIHRYSIKFGLYEELKTIAEDKIPSCQLVQAAYSELYGKQCPYNTTNNK